MSGKQTGSLQIPWAFSLTDAARLPVTGERHPLRREAVKWLCYGSGIALVSGALVVGGLLIWTSARDSAPVTREIRIVRYTELGVPPSLSRPGPPQLSIAQAVAPPSIGVPEPVPEEVAESPTIATVTEMAEALAPITATEIGSVGGESLAVEIDVEPSPAPDEFVDVDEEPVRISMDPPEYPEVAKQAGIEGTVIVRALVGKDGKVKDSVVMEGHPLLKDAALRSAKTAIFRPALVQHRPVEVWVALPITFQLQ